MKKSVKALIVAASVAAVVGVAGVSYAAWAGNTPVTATQEGSTGVVRVLGNLSVTALEESISSGTTLKTLYPVDQGSTVDGKATTLPEGGVKYWGFTVTAPTTTDGGSITYKLKGAFADDDTPGNAKLYWTATEPTSGAVDGAKEISTTNGDEIAVGTGYVYMVADGTDAMNASITLTFSAE